MAGDEAEVGLLNREGVARKDQLAADRVVMGESRQTGGARLDKPPRGPTKKPKK
jgi:hypothetical protein